MKIAMITTNRSDVGLLRPIRIEAERRGHDVCTFSDGTLNPREYDWCICGFDRVEMPPIAWHLFIRGGHIAQPAAGDVRIGGGDERHRWAISAYASLLLPWTEMAWDRCQEFVAATEIPTSMALTGPTTWDHVEPKVPRFDKDIRVGMFDLVLINPPFAEADLRQIKDLTHDRATIWLRPNESVDHPAFTEVVNLTHQEFLGVLSICDRFITNSSSAWYAAPKALKPEKIIRIGERNQVGDPVKFLPNNEASKRTVNALEKFARGERNECQTSSTLEKGTPSS
jgi:hypothetical protein